MFILFFIHFLFLNYFTLFLATYNYSWGIGAAAVTEKSGPYKLLEVHLDVPG